MSELHETAVVILNYNGVSFLEQFLPSVISNTPEAAIYVVDNGSTDASVSFLKKSYPTVSLIETSKNLGFCGGYNFALKLIKAEYYVLLNSDVEVSKGWLPPLINHLKSSKDHAACQPKILSYQDKGLFDYAGAAGGFLDLFGYPFCRGRLFGTIEEDKGQYDSSMEVFWASGACLCINADLFHKIGGLDSSFFAHMEEIDLCWRLKNEGFKVHAIPQSKVFHVGGGTLDRLSPFKTFLNFRNNLLLLAKNTPDLYLFPILFVRLILDGLAGFYFLFSGKAKHMTSVIKAHFSFYLRLPSVLLNRLKKGKRRSLLSNTLFRSSIVWLYFVKKIKRFEQLKG